MLKFAGQKIPILPLIFLIAAPIAAGIFYIAASYKNNISIVPNFHNYLILPFNDYMFHGKSEILGFTSAKNIIGLEYMLKKHNNTFPFTGLAGIWIQLGIKLPTNLSAGQLNRLSPDQEIDLVFDYTGYKFPDLNGYDYLRAEVEDSGSGDILFELINYDKNITLKNNPMSYVFMSYDCVMNQKKGSYFIPLKDFQIQAWWFAINNIKNNFKSYNDYSHILSLLIQTGYRSPVDKKAGFTVNGLMIGQDHTLLLLRVFAGLVVYSAVISIAFLLLGRKNTTAIAVPYEKIAAGNRADNESDRVVSYFAANYKNPEFSLLKIAGDLGIHQARIGDILNKNYKMSFRRYLNFVRMSETKRLLTSTDLSITEIAFAVGFNNVTHFNRTFKIIEKTTPKEYRKKYPNYIHPPR